MVIYTFTTYDKDGKQIRIHTLSARKAEELLEIYGHDKNFYGSHVFGQSAKDNIIEDLKSRNERFL